MRISSPIAALLLLVCAACTSSPFKPAPEHPGLLLVEGAKTPLDPAPGELRLLGRYYGVELSEAPEVGDSPSALELRQLLEAQGFTVFSFSGNLGPTATGLRGSLGRGRPLLVLVETDQGALWLLAVGIDEASAMVLFQRSDGTIEALDTADFDSFWNKRKRVTILALPELRSP